MSRGACPGRRGMLVGISKRKKARGSAAACNTQNLDGRLLLCCSAARPWPLWFCLEEATNSSWCTLGIGTKALVPASILASVSRRTLLDFTGARVLNDGRHCVLESFDGGCQGRAI
eukprot:scaffold320_cov335-Pavlova_lutheri.AAC.30